MVKKLMNIFKTINQMEEVILANYLLQPGIYFIIRKDHKIEGPRVVKKGQVVEDILYEWLKKADYYSQLTGMKKGNNYIYSSNYLSLLMDYPFLTTLKENSISEIEKEIEQFYEKKKDKKLNEEQEELRIQADIKWTSEIELENKRQIAKEMLPEIIEHLQQVDFPEQGCVKIFFEESIEKYKKEYEKYVISNEVEKGNLEINDTILDIVRGDLGSLYFNCPEEKYYERIPIQDALLLKRAFEWLICIVEDDEITNKIYLPEDFRFDREIEDAKNMEKSIGYIAITKKIDNGKTQIQELEKMLKIPQING